MSSPNSLAERPAHVPESALFDFDIFHDPELLQDPHRRALSLLQSAPPLFWSPRNGGHWIALRHADTHTVLCTPQTFSSSLLSPRQQVALAAQLPPDAPRFPQLTPIMMDPPQHTKYRLPLQRVFSPRTVMAMRDEIETLAQQLIDEVADQGGCDFIAAVAEQFPVRVFLKLMGLPAGRLAEFRALVREVFAPSNDDPLVYGRRIRKVADAMMDVILARRDAPRDDLISQLWSLRIDDEPMTLELMEDYSTLFFLAGLDTVINGIGFGMRHLAGDPVLQQQLRENPTLIAATSEELLRRYTFTIPVRRIVHDTELGGRQLRADDKILLYLPAADLDAAAYTAPEHFDIHREQRAHMAFGTGPHHCLGASLARLELQILYRVVLQRLPPFRIDDTQPIRFHAGQMLTLANLPLRWN